MKLVSEELSVKNAAEWDAFVLSQSSYTPFMGSPLFFALQHNPFYQAYGRVFRPIDQPDRIAGGYIFYVVQEMRGVSKWLTTRVLLNGGPWIHPDYHDDLDDILCDLCSHPGTRGVYLDIWHTEDISKQQHVFTRCNFEYIPHLNYIIDLSEGRDVTLNRIKDRKRRYIKRNINKIGIRSVESIPDLVVFYNLLKETYARIRLPLIDFRVFQDVYNAGCGLFYLAEHDGVAVAARAVLTFGRSEYDWYMGEKRVDSNLHVNESMVWWALEYGIDHGFEWFNFGGAGSPDYAYGVRDFKAEFGGQLTNFGRHRYTRFPIVGKLINIALQIHRRSKKIFEKRGKKTNDFGERQ